MIFLHGWGGDVRSFLFIAKNLGVSATLVDFYGFGKTPHPDYPLTVKDYAEGVIETMDAAGIAKADIVGHSFGGRVAIYLAAYYPERVNKLVLVDSAGVKPRRGIKYYFRITLHKILKKFGLTEIYNEKKKNTEERKNIRYMITKFAPKRSVETKNGKKYVKKAKIQRLVTPDRLRRKRIIKKIKEERRVFAKKQKEEYHKLLKATFSKNAKKAKKADEK